MVAQAFKVSVVSRPLLPTVGLADRAVHVENPLFEQLPPMDLVNPLAGELHQRRQVALGAECVGLESADLAGRGRMLLRLVGSAAYDMPHAGSTHNRSASLTSS